MGEPAVIAQVDHGVTIGRCSARFSPQSSRRSPPTASVELERFRALCRHLVENGSDGVVVTGTTGEAPTLSDDERFALYEVAVDEIGADAHGRRRHRHVRHGPLGAPDGARARDRRGRLPRRDAVLQQAAAARDRRARRGDRGRRPTARSSSTTSRAASSSTPSPRRSRRSRRSRTCAAVKQAKPSLDAARHVVACGLDLYAGDDDLILPFLEVGGVGGICVHTHVVGPQVKEMITRYRAGDTRRRPRDRRGAAPRDRSPPRADEPDRDQDGAEPARPRRSAASGCRSSTRRPRRRPPCAAASSGSGCCSRSPPDAAAAPHDSADARRCEPDPYTAPR